MPDKTKYDAEEVFRRVDRLYDSTEMQEHRRLMEENWRLHDMEQSSTLPSYVTRRTDAQIDMPSELLMQTSQNLEASIDAYPRFVTVVPYNAKGTPTADERDRADKVERHATLARMKCDENASASPLLRFHQINSGYGVMVERCLPPPKGDARKKPFFHMQWDVIDPTTCGFPMQSGGYFRPTEFGWKKEMLVKEVESDYADWDGNGLRPLCSKGQWTLVAVTEGEAINQGDTLTGWTPDGKDGKKDAVKCQVYGYDDGQYQYIAVKGLEGGRDKGRFAGQDKNGLILWCDKNPIGRVMAHVVCGQALPKRGKGRLAKPVLEALIVNQKGVNFLGTFVATISMTNPNDMIINASPEQLKAMQGMGLVQRVGDLELQAGGPYLIHVGGQPTEFKWAPTEGPLAFLEMKRADGERLAQDWKPLIDKDLLTQPTATAYTLGTEVQEQLKTSMLKHLDRLMSEATRDYLDSAITYNDVAPMNVYAHGEVRRLNNGPIASGSANPLASADLKDFEYEVFVSTRQETEGQLGMRMQQGAWEEDRGYTSTRQVMGMKYLDETAQHKEMLNDQGRKMAGPVQLEIVGTIIEAKLLTRAHVKVREGSIAYLLQNILTPPDAAQALNAGQQQQGASGAGPRPQSFTAPATNGAQGQPVPV